MKKIKLIRFLDDGKKTLGYLKIPELPYELWTLELPSKNNQKEISCIPTGEYLVKNHISDTHGDCFLITEVKNRDNILFHVGNYPQDTKGCILPGLGVSNIKGKDAVVKSELALLKMKEIFKEDFMLEILSIF